MVKFINITVHPLTDEQKKCAEQMFGEVEFFDYKELYPELAAQVANSPSDKEGVMVLAEKVARTMGDGSIYHLPGGSPAFCWALAQRVLLSPFLARVVFSNSERQSSEVTLPDGSVKKTSVFAFKGFTELPTW